MKARPIQDVPRIGLTIEEAAAAVGMSHSHFKKHVLPNLKVVRSGAVRVIAVKELERWIDREGTIAGGWGRG